MWEERADDGTGEPAARAVLPVVAGIVRPRRASVARDSTADRRRGHSSGVPKPVRADRPPLDSARTAVLGPRRRLFARGDERAQAVVVAAVLYVTTLLRLPSILYWCMGAIVM